MPILSKIRDFISRNKNKFFLGGIIITGSVFLTKYAQQKLKDWQEKEMLEFLDRTRKQQHFENISRTWNQTFVTLANSLTDIVSQAFDTDKIISELRSKPHNKMSSWENLKCKNVVDLIDLKKQMRLCDIDALFWSLETAICDSEDNPLDNLNSYINWRLNDNGTNEDIYHDLIRDSQDLLETDEVKSLTSQCVNRGFIQLANQLSDFYMEQSTTGSKDLVYSNQEDFDHFKIKKPLAKLLPIINGLLSKNSFPEKLKQQLITYDKPQIFAANIFESLL
ncbi:hypothetical protein WA026_013826 [Henosepilachna vigintioctopunctata]|uniref:Peroxisomal biogenesis factor 3 n=1 Tax=Henosepilachna vigintioctopunctata TaxID=420089 RepID=A0AAW1UYM1_9CUCU